jgi:YggT family protein
MYFFGNILIGFAQVLNFVLQLYFFVLLGRAICSWVQANPRNPIVLFLYMATEPPLRVIRRLLPMNLRYFPIDIAFLVLVGIVIFLQYGIVPSIGQLGVQLGGGQVMR